MDIPREDSGKKRLIRRTLTGSVVVAALLGITAGVYRLQPAAPPFEYATAWHDTVKRGPMVREVHGTGSLVPEDAMLITASSDGRVERILIRPGTPVKADSVVMILTSPELETQLLDAEYALKAAEADLANLKVTLEKAKLDIQSTVAQVGADFNIAKLQADRDEALAKEGLFPHIDAKISAVKAQQLSSRYQLEQKRLSINADAEEAQLAAQKVKVEQLRGQYNLKKSLVDQLKVRAGFSGMLQALPPPLTPVEEGQKVVTGTPLGKVAQPAKLKAELKIAETQVKDVTIGQRAAIDTHNGLIQGHVSRIDPSILNGTVTVDVALDIGKEGLPPGARPDLSIDGTIELERLSDVVYMGRPVFGQENAAIQIFKVDPDARYANKVKVMLGRTSVNTIEVKDGLKVGDTVILSDMSGFDSVDRIKLN